jgi:hypothetical protein
MEITQVKGLQADAGKVYVFVRLHMDTGIVGVGEPSGMGKAQAVVGAVQDLTHF